MSIIWRRTHPRSRLVPGDSELTSTVKFDAKGLAGGSPRADAGVCVRAASPRHHRRRRGGRRLRRGAPGADRRRARQADRAGGARRAREHAAGRAGARRARAATAGPARFLGADSLGAVRAGKLADLVLLDADPLADIRGTRRIVAVIFDGRLLSAPPTDSLRPRRP
ncbi:MAG TPA: amidohydrolase family protein [Longimicrobiaceae bacterium]|nr:amidohydrolase family protein [Longimicrobiaceae bacterium]